MKTNAIVRIILLSLAILVLAGILFFGLALGGLIAGFKDTEIYQEIMGDPSDVIVLVEGEGKTATYAARDINALEINWVAGSIRIEPMDTDVITVREDAVSQQKYEMVLKKSGSTLSIDFCKDEITRIGISNFASFNKDLVITVPRNWTCRELELNVASAEVYIADMTIDKVDFDGASGELRLNNCHVDMLDLDTASGDVEFVGALNELECDAASANCNIEVTNIPSRINIDCASGDLDLTLPENCGFSCDMDTLSGDFSSDFSTVMNNGRHTYGNGACRIDLSGMSGDITIHKAAAATDSAEETQPSGNHF